MSVFIIAEIGINHNGDLDIAKQLIKAAKDCGADAVKFQKRTVEKVYTKEVLDSPRESPWGTTQRAQKLGLEFEKTQYDEIDRYCGELGIEWFGSAWDLDAQAFLAQYKCRYNKIASAMLTNLPLVEMIAKEGKHTFVSTGMHELEEIDKVVDLLRQHDCPLEIMHCNSQYPMPPEEANLRIMETLRRRYGCDIGYSGHETGVIVSVAAAALGATSIERHITLDRAMYGSDQAASLEVGGFHRLVDYVRTVEVALGSEEKVIGVAEKAVRAKLAPSSAAMGLI